MARYSPEKVTAGVDQREPKTGLYRKASGSNVSTLARAKRGEPEELSASEEEDLKDKYYSYWERQKQVGEGNHAHKMSDCFNHRDGLKGGGP